MICMTEPKHTVRYMTALSLGNSIDLTEEKRGLGVGQGGGGGE